MLANDQQRQRLRNICLQLSTALESSQTLGGSTEELAQGKADKRLSLKGRRVFEELDVLKAISHIENTTDLIKGVILKINDDILVKKRPKPTRELKNIVAAVA